MDRLDNDQRHEIGHPDDAYGQRDPVNDGRSGDVLHGGQQSSRADQNDRQDRQQQRRCREQNENAAKIHVVFRKISSGKPGVTGRSEMLGQL